jgi:hypothetical protein
MSITRMFRRPPQHGRAGANEATAVSINPILASSAPKKLDAHRLFVERYPILRKGLEAHPKQGLLVFAFDDGASAVGQAWLAATLDRTRVAIIGRHSMCHLALPAEHGEISLRHAVLLVRAISHTEVRVRVLDLHTETGFCDEGGRVLQAVTAEGSLFLRIGGVTLVMLVTGDGAPLDDAEAAYAVIPERVLLEERPGTAGVPERREVRRPTDEGSRVTYVHSQFGPIAAAANLASADEPSVASLVVRAGGGSVRTPVGASILDRGFLVGRYARCELGVGSDDGHSRLSRVHLVVVREGGDVIAIDAASTNGTEHEGKVVQSLVLEDGTKLELGGELTLVWHVER